jgi:hypothetical protein
VAPEALVREYRTHTVWLPAKHPEWWALFHDASPEARWELTRVPPPAAGRISIVTWRLPFAVRGIDVRYFREWRRVIAHGEGRVLLGVELEGPPGDSSKERDSAVQDRLDELSWVVERLWLASADEPFERLPRDRRSGRRQRTGSAAQLPAGADDGDASAPPTARGAEGLILVRPDGVTMLGTALAPEERQVLDMAVESKWITAVDIQSTVAPSGGPRAAETTSRLLGRLRSVGAIHPAELRGDEEPPPAPQPGRGGQVRLHRSALHAATRAMLDSLDRREVLSPFSQRRALHTIQGEGRWANRLRVRLRGAGLLTI